MSTKKYKNIPLMVLAFLFILIFPSNLASGSVQIYEENASYPEITRVETFTRMLVRPGRPDEWYMFFFLRVNDPMGVPDNIASVTAVNLDTQTDPNTYT